MVVQTTEWKGAHWPAVSHSTTSNDNHFLAIQEFAFMTSREPMEMIGSSKYTILALCAIGQ